MPAPAPPYATGSPAAGYGYTSPIPIRETHLGHALASEWTKIKSVRSTVWTLSTTVVLIVGVGLLVAGSTDDRDFTDVPTTIPGLFGTMLGQLCVITLGVLVVTAEYGTGMIRTTFTASPQRARVLTAKALVFFVLAFTITTASLVLVGLASKGMHSGPDVMEPDTQQVLGGTVGAGLYVSLLGLLGLAVGSMLRHSAGAVTTMVGVVLLPSIIPVFLYTESLSSVREKMLEYSAPYALAGLFQINSDDLGSGWPQLGLLAGVTAVAYIGAFALLDRRDV
ncbi:ABC transporter permease subunit [Streptomyces sp. M19]